MHILIFRADRIKHDPKFWILFSGQFSRQNQKLQEENAGNSMKDKIVADPKCLPIFDMKIIVTSWDCKEIVCSCTLLPKVNN